MLPSNGGDDDRVVLGGDQFIGVAGGTAPVYGGVLGA